MRINKRTAGILRQAIREMTLRQTLYKVLKEELTTLGYWRNRARGNPKKGYQKKMENAVKRS